MITRPFITASAVAATILLAGRSDGALIDFEDLALGTRYFDNDTFTSGGVTMTVSNVGGHIDVQDFADAGGTGNELEFFGGSGGGISLDFDFGSNLVGLSLLYGAYGGTLNLAVNGDSVVVVSFADLPASLGGVDITLTGDPFGPGALLSFDGTIQSFAIGGQEFVLDDVVFTPLPGPGGLTLLGLGMLAPARRRRGRESSP